MKEIAVKEIAATARRPAGLKYSLPFFDDRDRCPVRFDNRHAARKRGRPGPIAFDHWRRFGDDQLVPYKFIDAETLIGDFFEAIDAHLPPELRVGA
ncbi:MAG TPA: DUF6516 family protein [Stellaceae bacterium]|nr:DUF6516 family protein [Stellaceae bacterium]